MTAEEVLCRFMEHEYGLAAGSVARVTVEQDFDGGYSDMTPGIGNYVELAAYDADGKVLRLQTESDHVELIKELTQFAAGLIP